MTVDWFFNFVETYVFPVFVTIGSIVSAFLSDGTKIGLLVQFGF